jgi:syntaxin-binding protein 1
MYWIDSDSSVLRHASGDFKRLGNRIFVFMIGGATRSEVCCLPQNINLHSSRAYYMFISFQTSMDQLRTAHKLTMKMKREIVLGSSSIDEPLQFISVKYCYFFKVFVFLFFHSLPAYRE